MGNVRNTFVYIPIDTIQAAGQKKVHKYDREWQRVLASTGQRSFYDPALKDEMDAKFEKQNED